MNRLIIEQRKTQIKNQESNHYELLICDDYGDGIISYHDLSQDKDQSNKFYDDDRLLIQDLLKTYFRDGFGESINSILDRLTQDNLSIRVDDVYYDYEELKDIIKQTESECS
jgi:hypothetical protein